MELSTSTNALAAFKHVTAAGDQIYPSFELRIILNYLESQGEQSWCTTLLERVGLKPSDLEVPFISAYQALLALEYFVEEKYQAGMGCDIAANYRLADIGSIGQCLGHCATLGQALEITVDYYQLLGSFTDITNLVSQNLLTNRLVNVVNLPARIQQCLFELTVKGLTTIGYELSGQKVPIKAVRFQTELADDELIMYQQKFGCPVQGNQTFDEWDLDLSFSELPVLHSDPASLSQHLDLLESDLQSHKGLVDDIDEILSCSPGDYPDPDMIAHALGLSSRTLRRRLKQLGTSYSALMNKVRCQSAIKLIYQNQMTNEQIASYLGFSDSANFQHAFKKWTGKTPSFYRG